MEETQQISQFDVLKNKDDYKQFTSYLKQHRYDFDEVSIDGKSLVMSLIESDTPTEFIWFALEYFADPNIQDNIGNTALHYAFEKNNKNCILLLLLFNADLEIRNKEKDEKLEEELQHEGLACYERTSNLFKEEDLDKLRTLFDDNFKLVFANLTRHRRDKIREIYNFLDEMKTGISEERLYMFNVWINEDKNEVAKEDAKIFMNLAKMFGNSASEIYFEEYIIALTKIAAFHGTKVIDDFIELFDNAISSGRKMDDGYS